MGVYTDVYIHIYIYISMDISGLGFPKIRGTISGSLEYRF